MADILPFLFFHSVLIWLNYSIIRKTRSYGRKAGFYWVLISLYGLTILWLLFEYLSTARDAGSDFVIVTVAVLVPGGLTLLAIFVFVVTRFILLNLDIKKKRERL